MMVQLLVTKKNPHQVAPRQKNPHQIALKVMIQMKSQGKEPTKETMDFMSMMVQYCLKIVNVEKGMVTKKNSDGVLIFPDEEEFRPNMTPKEVLQAGSFGGTYFRPIKSSVTGLKYNKMWDELPQNWLEGLSVKRYISSVHYDEKVNTYKAKCGGSLEMWEESGWIDKIDPYGWFMWYCRFYLGRRSRDDNRQIGRWKNCTGPKGRWKNNLIGKVARAGVKYNNSAISPVIRQTLQHWAYRLTEKDYLEGKKRVKM